MTVYAVYRMAKGTFKLTWKTLSMMLIAMIFIGKFTWKYSYKFGNWLYYKSKYKDAYYSKERLWTLIRSVSPRQFEVFCYELYKALGYKAKITQEMHDGGVDIILKKGKETIYVECKHYAKNNYIGREICQKLLGSCIMNKADKAIVFTTGGIHNNAKECEAMVDHLEIVGYDKMYDLFNKLDKDTRNKVLANTMSYV